MIKESLLSLFAVAVGFAQPSAGAPPVTALKMYLNLSDTQFISISNAIRTSMEANRTIADQIHTKHEALQTLLSSGSAEAATIGRAMIEIQSLRKQLEAGHSKAREQGVSFLTVDQKHKLKSLEDADKLRDEIREAHAFHLLAPSAGGSEDFGGPAGPGPRRIPNFR